jgi:hypothetical protein
MNFGSDLKNIIDSFAPISLNEMDDVRMMRRVDNKFVLNIRQLPVLLQKALVDYYLLEINHIREQIYETTYYDTNDYTMYNQHHNGKLNRYKIRVRKYVCSNLGFLEVKRKNNKGETIKNRIKCPEIDNHLDFAGSTGFLEKYTPYSDKILWPKLVNRFSRLTMVNKDFSERITIDFNLKFSDLKYHTHLVTSNLCIVEIKRNRESKKSPFLNTLFELKISNSGFSKYCIGLAILNPEVKTNLFKQKIRELKKI